MRLTPSQPNTTLYETGFGAEDILGRASTGRALSDLVERLEDPVVIALNGAWGSGKSHFLQRWVGAHGLENGGKAITVYFDAFAHDYLGDPLPALVTALADRLDAQKGATVQALDKVKAAAFKLLKPAARLGLAAASYGATELASAAGDAVIKATESEAQKQIDAFWREQEGRRAAMAEFRSAMEALVAQNQSAGEGAALVIVVDELDRCRPDYALQVLEVIKHFFDVPKVHFVLGVNLLALETSVRAHYGGDLDARAYLQKFINVTLELPQKALHSGEEVSVLRSYLSHLVKVYDIHWKFADELSKLILIVAENLTVSLRDLERIFANVVLADGALFELNQNSNSGLLSVAMDLLVAKVLNPDIYEKMLSATLSHSDMVSYYGAREEVGIRDPSDSNSTSFRQDVSCRYMLWANICSENIQNAWLSKPDGNLFSRPWSEMDFRTDAEVPRFVYRTYLDRFSLYRNTPE